MDRVRRKLLAAGAAATAMATASRVFAQNAGQGGEGAMSFYEKGPSASTTNMKNTARDFRSCWLPAVD